MLPVLSFVFGVCVLVLSCFNGALAQLPPAPSGFSVITLLNAIGTSYTNMLLYNFGQNGVLYSNNQFGFVPLSAAASTTGTFWQVYPSECDNGRAPGNQCGFLSFLNHYVTTFGFKQLQKQCDNQGLGTFPMLDVGNGYAPGANLDALCSSNPSTNEVFTLNNIDNHSPFIYGIQAQFSTTNQVLCISASASALTLAECNDNDPAQRWAFYAQQATFPSKRYHLSAYVFNSGLFGFFTNAGVTAKYNSGNNNLILYYLEDNYFQFIDINYPEYFTAFISNPRIYYQADVVNGKYSIFGMNYRCPANNLPWLSVSSVEVGATVGIVCEPAYQHSPSATELFVPNFMNGGSFQLQVSNSTLCVAAQTAVTSQLLLKSCDTGDAFQTWTFTRAD